MWKTTDRYVQQKRVKAVEAESKLKQVYIPNYTKPSPALITNNNKNILNGNSNGSSGVEVLTISGGKPCESCSTLASPQVRYSNSKVMAFEGFVGCSPRDPLEFRNKILPSLGRGFF